MAEITLTNRELNQAGVALRSIGQKPLKNIRVAFAIAVMKRVTKGPLDDLQTANLALVKHYANGSDPIKPDGLLDLSLLTDRAAYDADFNKLMDEKVALPGVRPIELKDLDGTEGFTADDLYLLGPLVITSAE